MQIHNLKTQKNAGHYIELYLPFYCLLAYYNDIFWVSLGTVGLFIVALLSIKDKKNFRWGKNYKIYTVFFLYVLFRDIVKVFSFCGNEQAQINRILEYVIMFFLVFIVCSREFDEDILYKAWKVAGTIYLLGLLYHIVKIYILGKMVLPISIIPGYSGARLHTPLDRPTSFFPEPSAFVAVMMPLEFLALKRKEMKWAIVSTLSILASTSTTGIVLSIVLWGYTFIYGKMKKKYKFAMLFVAIVIIVVFLNTSIFQFAINKMNGILHGGGTLGVRVSLGFDIIKSMNWHQWIFGTSNINGADFVAQNIEKFSTTSLPFIYYQKNAIFFNAFCYAIFGYGIIGLCLMLETYLGKLRRRKYDAKALVFVCLVATIGESMFLNAYYFQMTMLILLYCNYKPTQEIRKDDRSEKYIT